MTEAKLHTNDRYTCGSNAEVDEYMFSYTKCPKKVQSHPIPGIIKILKPMDSTLNYFEFAIISGGAIGIGMGASDYPLDSMPGWDPNSIGYHAIDGKCFHQSGKGTEFGTTCTAGDRMGCGVDFRSRDDSLGLINVFFTKNGQQVGDTVRIKMPTDGLCPLIGMCSEGDKVQYLGRQHHLPLTLKVKSHTNNRCTCGNNAAVEEDLFTYNSVEKIFGKNPGVVKILEPMDSTLNYFEFEIISGGKECAVGIGVGASDYPLDRMPGWNLNSIGYHANDGKCFHQCGQGMEFGPACTIGDRMGCGVDFRSDDSSGLINVFFTKNGEQVGDVVRIMIPTGGLYPLIGMCSEGEIVQYLGHWNYLPQTLKVKLHANGRYMCGNNAAVDDDLFVLTKCPKDTQVHTNWRPGVVKIMTPMDSNFNYFEFKIISSGKACELGIGLGASDYHLDDMPGWNQNSIGYHADDGKIFCENGQGTEFGPTCTAGDRMGCGVDFRSHDDYLGLINVFFTKNGKQVGAVVRIMIPPGGLYPLIGMSSVGEQVQYLGHWHYLPQAIKGDEVIIQVCSVQV